VTAAPAAGDTSQSADASNSTAFEAAPTAGYPPPTAPIADSGSQSPNTTQLEQPAGGAPAPSNVQPATQAQPGIGALRLVEISLAALAVLLGLGALWVRRRSR
jgi:hypothetical protein